MLNISAAFLLSSFDSRWFCSGIFCIVQDAISPLGWGNLARLESRLQLLVDMNLIIAIISVYHSKSKRSCSGSSRWVLFVSSDAFIVCWRRPLHEHSRPLRLVIEWILVDYLSAVQSCSMKPDSSPRAISSSQRCYITGVSNEHEIELIITATLTVRCDAKRARDLHYQCTLRLWRNWQNDSSAAHPTLTLQIDEFELFLGSEPQARVVSTELRERNRLKSAPLSPHLPT